jgi:cold shock CspA family protein
LGIVKSFDCNRGCGFIEPHDGGGDVFVHERAILGNGRTKSLSPGQLVEFIPLFDGKSTKAKVVRTSLSSW